ncbi:hypothetical protein [Mucilaginibacter sp.]|uniref:hypothetical protein n=1 Tax=Mucilaginibacter sp. TaxID=1882438 RepID=UPI0035BBE1E2
MDTSKYLIIPLIAIASAACNPKPKPANLDALKSTDTALILKTEPADSSKKQPDTVAAISSDEGAGKPITAQRLIIPGKSIGQTGINESMENVYNRFGKPDSSDAAMGSALAVWYADHNKAGYKTAIFSRHNYNGKDDIFQYVKRILVTSPYFKTAEGLGVGSNLNDIQKQYALKPGNGYKDKGRQINVFDNVAKGISFEIDPVTNKCVGVLIQKPGDAAGSYLNMN